MTQFKVNKFAAWSLLLPLSLQVLAVIRHIQDLNNSQLFPLYPGIFYWEFYPYVLSGQLLLLAAGYWLMCKTTNWIWRTLFVLTFYIPAGMAPWGMQWVAYGHCITTANVGPVFSDVPLSKYFSFYQWVPLPAIVVTAMWSTGKFFSGDRAKLKSPEKLPP